MWRVTFVLALASGVIAAPLLCDAGVLVHECICNSTDCCVEEVTCDLDPCDDVYKTEGWRKQDPVTNTVLALLMIGVEVSPEGENPTTPPVQRISVNRPFPDSDLPLRI